MSTLSRSFLKVLAWLVAFVATTTMSQSAASNESAYQPQPYTVDVDPALVQQMRDKAATFRATGNIEQPAWYDGPPVSDVAAIAKHWAEQFDWVAVQGDINNNFSHYLTTIPPPGNNYSQPLDIHFIHQVSARSDAIPILMLHGWPSTSLEWERVIRPLTSPDDDSQPAFHIIAPDLPGFGFSPAPITPGLGSTELAAVFSSLMQQLGYEKYVLYGTDLGFIVSRTMVNQYPKRIINHITDFYAVFPTPNDVQQAQSNQSTPEELAYIVATSDFLAYHNAYQAIHSTYPLSIAYALNDSPVGFLAWMWQVVYTLSDKAYSATELITLATTLWVPGVYGNIRAYKELFPTLQSLTSGEDGVPNVPTSILQFGGTPGYPALKDVNFVPREWVERSANVTYFNRHNSGGHFPAYGEPQLVIDDIRAIFARR